MGKIFRFLVFFILIFVGIALYNLVYNEDNPMISTDVKLGKVDNSPEKIYEKLLTEVKAYSEAIVFNNADEKSVISIYKKMVKEHPEIFWINEGYSYQKTTLGRNAEIVFKPTYCINFSQIEEKRLAFEAKVEEIIAETKLIIGDFNLILYVHDYIVNNTFYDSEVAKLIEVDDPTASNKESITAYGCLINGKAVCSGYAAAFQTIMQRLGYECGRVTGKKIGGENHEWNYIKAQNEYYYIDVTWDDPVSENGKNNISYDYFLITTDELTKTHIIGEKQDVPECNGQRLNYFIYNGLYIEQYSYSVVSRIISTNIGRGTISLKFSNQTERDAAVNDLFSKDMVFDIPGIKNVFRTLSYSVSDTGNTLTIILF